MRIHWFVITNIILGFVFTAHHDFFGFIYLLGGEFFGLWVVFQDRAEKKEIEELKKQLLIAHRDRC